MDAISILKANRMYDDYKDMEYIGETVYIYDDITYHRVIFKDFFDCVEYVDFKTSTKDGELLPFYEENPDRAHIHFKRGIESIDEMRKILALVDAKEKADAKAATA